MTDDQPFIEVGFWQQAKAGQHAAGDVFLSNRIPGPDRLVCVLSDGLGSGIKANVLATMTATMALKYVSADINIKKASEIIMETLPVCSSRKIGYATFTIVDVEHDGHVRIIEYDNPAYVLIRQGKKKALEKSVIEIQTKQLGIRELRYSSFTAQVEDRLVLVTDGVTQSGMGKKEMPVGWTDSKAADFITVSCMTEPGISARKLSRNVVQRALRNDCDRPKDDISCAVINFRTPRRALLLTGPPFDPDRDTEIAVLIRDFSGIKIICGGTTANIVARELKRSIDIDLSELDPQIPPPSRMDGVHLITEGTITLSRMAEHLENGDAPESLKQNPAVQLMRLLLESDIIDFVVGTKINEAHQDPNLPVELDIRRNLIRRIVRLLNEKYMKAATIRFI
jgi:hypothetical protein